MQGISLPSALKVPGRVCSLGNALFLEGSGTVKGNHSCATHRLKAGRITLYAVERVADERRIGNEQQHAPVPFEVNSVHDNRPCERVGHCVVVDDLRDKTLRVLGRPRIDRRGGS